MIKTENGLRSFQRQRAGTRSRQSVPAVATGGVTLFFVIRDSPSPEARSSPRGVVGVRFLQNTKLRAAGGQRTTGHTPGQRQAMRVFTFRLL